MLNKVWIHVWDDSKKTSDDHRLLYYNRALLVLYFEVVPALQRW